MSQAQFIFFDAVNTLFHVKGSVGEVYAQVAKSFGVQLDAQKTYADFKTVFPKMPPLCFPNTPASKIKSAEKTWWLKLVSQVVAPEKFKNTAKFNLFFEALYGGFSDERYWELYPDTLAALNQLRSKKIRLGILSNFDSRLFSVLRALGVANLFEVVICSTAVGLAKPDPAIFKLAQGKVRPLKASEILMVGNEQLLDIEPAKAVGFQARLLDRAVSSLQDFF